MMATEWLAPLAAGVAIAIVFVALNYRAYDGFFQDDELENIMWAPHVGAMKFVVAFVKPLFDVDNFRPVGHFYFAVMGKLFGEDFPPYVTPIFALHLVNGLLIFALIRRLRVGVWQALAAVTFFLLSAGAFDAYWKPMYCFDLLCTAFCLSSILLYSRRQWMLSFLAFWCAYKSKELAVMLPLVLVAWEYWLGDWNYRRLIPFLLVSVSFGLQGLWRNPNVDNDYAFRFTGKALTATVPFYAARFLLCPGSGLLLVSLLLIRDRRIWFGLTAAFCFLFTLLFLPGRLFEAYSYLPLACTAVALAAAASHVRPVWFWLALLLWLPWNVRDLRQEQRAKLAADDTAYVFVDTLNRWVADHPSITTLVYDRPPGEYHDWGVGAAWNIAHREVKLPAYFVGSVDGQRAMANGRVVYAGWDAATNRLMLEVRAPRQAEEPAPQKQKR
jgi:hypothetical protein